ncbi:MAG: phage holin family protein [Acidobacteria bacterium]|nr:phage holin family protein [Acidobacteriota bacterium]MBP8273112.1 phage holin family protein [Acidobacteriota bacterium]
MTGIVLTWVANSAAIWLVAYLFSGITVASWTDAFVAGLVLTLVNAVVRPILLVLTLPITIVTLGLFYFVISAICLGLTARLIDGFAVSGWFNTIVASIFISIASTLIQSALKGNDARP